MIGLGILTCEKVDSFHVRGGMPQPEARRYFSTLLVFKRQPR